MLYQELHLNVVSHVVWSLPLPESTDYHIKEVRIFQVGLIPIETLADTYNFTAGFLED